MDIGSNFFTWQCSYSTAAFLMRLVVAVTLLPFGIKKWVQRDNLKNGFPEVMGLSHETSFYLALFAETFAPCCLIFGFFTRIAALGGVLNMGIAYLKYIHFPAHKNDPYYYAPSLPILLGYICVLILGPGKFSLDHLFF